MKKLMFIFGLGVMALSTQAQTSLKEIEENPDKAAGNYLAYPTPTAKLTPAPEGYTPFYISHYGRHGSRYMLTSGDAKEPYEILDMADAKGKLTKLGQQVKSELQRVKEIMDKRAGELTPLGHQQHKEIAKRMFNNYPTVFADSANIDAKSTTVVRCVLSMGSFCQELKSLNPKLKITNDASEHDMYYMCKGQDNAHKAPDSEVKWKKKHEAFCDSLSQPERLMSILFTDKNYLDRKRAGKLSRQLFNVACDLQDMPDIDFDLWGIFTPQEIFDTWQSQNAYWYGFAGLSPIQDGNASKVAKNLLNDILTKADAAIATGKPCATLRFGHDTGILPLIALMNLNNNSDVKVNDLKDLYKYWTDFKLIPMAANVQFIFYKNNKNDILLKVLMNEEEVKLPFESMAGPYYEWSKFKDYYQAVQQK